MAKTTTVVEEFDEAGNVRKRTTTTVEDVRPLHFPLPAPTVPTHPVTSPGTLPLEGPNRWWTHPSVGGIAPVRGTPFTINATSSDTMLGRIDSVLEGPRRQYPKGEGLAEVIPLWDRQDWEPHPAS